MLFTTETVKTEDLKKARNFFEQFENEYASTSDERIQEEAELSKYITSLVSTQYKKSVEDIENTHVGNTRIRKRTLQQVMQESFFSGSNRFGNNFIA